MANDLYQKIDRFAEKYKFKIDDHSSKDYFSAGLNVLISEYGLSNSEIAGGSISDASITKWRNGQSLPPKHSRQVILERILENISA